MVVLLDSLNRHHLGCYGGDEFETPNLDRFAARATRFDRHVTGSLPCMPARHDLLVGSLDFLWRPWGSIEIWEQPITFDAGRSGVTTMLVSDHPHLFEVGGENYHTDFTAWEYLRGHESDPWKTAPDPSWVGAPALPARVRGAPHGSDLSRTYFREEADFPGPKVMRTAADWIDRAAGHHERFLLVIDEFDPHEPFDTPAPWAGRYDPDWEGDLVIWPPYAVKGIERGVLTEREGRQVRANYGSKLSMIDHWFGTVLDALDRNDLWDDTAVIVCTDHGHYLGEKDVWGKPLVMQYETLGHIPLLIAWPGATSGACDALTTTVDLHATLSDIFDTTPEQRTHGRSLVPLLTSEVSTVREWAIGGIYGNWVQITDGHRKYARAAEVDNYPLSLWSNRWSTMPIHGVPEFRLPRPDGRATLDHMPGSSVPVIRQPFQPGDLLPFWVAGPVGRHHLFDLDEDPTEEHDRSGAAGGAAADVALERELSDLLVAALDEVEAPREQYERLGLS